MASRTALSRARTTLSRSRTVLSRSRVSTLYAYPQAVLRDRPTAYIRGNDASGPVALDSSPYGNDGVYSGSFSFRQPGIFTHDPSTGFKSNDNASYVTLPIMFEQQAEFTIEGIFKFPDALSFGTLIKYGEFGRGMALEFGGTYDDNPGTQLILLSDGIQISLSGYSLTPGQWYHVAVVNTGGNGILYVKGANVFSTAFGLVFEPATHCYIGYGVGGSSPSYYSDCAFYNYGLSAVQIANHAILLP